MNMNQNDNLDFLNQQLDKMKSSAAQDAKSNAAPGSLQVDAATGVLLSVLQELAKKNPEKASKFIAENKNELTQLTSKVSASTTQPTTTAEIKPTQVDYAPGPSTPGFMDMIGGMGNMFTKISGAGAAASTMPGLMGMAGGMKNKIMIIKDLNNKLEKVLGPNQLSSMIKNAEGTIASALKSMLGDTGANIAMGFLGINSSNPATATEITNKNNSKNAKDNTGKGSNILSDIFSGFTGKNDSQTNAQSQTSSAQSDTKTSSQGDGNLLSDLFGSLFSSEKPNEVDQTGRDRDGGMNV